MAIDIKKMQNKLAISRGEAKAAQTGPSYRLVDGKQILRIVPTADGDPFKELYFHYNLGTIVLCPKKNFGETCCVCEFATQLWNSGSPSSQETAKKLFANNRFVSPVIVRGQEERGVLWWGYGKKMYESILTLVVNPEYGDITNVDSGTDLNVEYARASRPGAYPTSSQQPSRSSTKLGTEEQQTEWLNNIPDHRDLYDRMTSAEVRVILDEFISSETSTVSSATTIDEPATIPDKVNDAFKQLLSE